MRQGLFARPTFSALRTSSQMPEQASHEAGFAFAGQLMFPDAEAAPAAGAEGAGDEAVAGAVGGDLFPPEGGVRFRRCGVEGAAGPEEPSTKTVTRCGRKTKSAFTRKAFNLGPSPFRRSVAPRRQPVMPCVRKSAMKRSSVAALPRERMADITVECFRRVKVSGIVSRET